MSPAIKSFCNDIGTTPRALEEGTPWSNEAELYIGLIRETTRKVMRISHSPKVLWDYCVECRARINNMTAKNSFKLHERIHAQHPMSMKATLLISANSIGTSGVTTEQS
jgi:hypothetical protein